MALYSEFSENQGFLIDKQESDLSFGKEQRMTLMSDINEIAGTQPILEEGILTELEKETLHFGFKNQPKPWFPPPLLQKLDKIKKGTIKREQLANAIEEIARITIDFYQVKSGRCIAARFDGRIVESADTEIDLLLKIQGKKFSEPVFVWQVGSDSFTGWRI